MKSVIAVVLVIGSFGVMGQAQAVTPQWADVTVFGAVGDGVTESTAAIQAAVDSLASSSQELGQEGIVYFPRGIYLVSRAIVVRATPASRKHNITLLGDGPNTSVLRTSANFPFTTPVVLFDAGSTTNIKFARVRHLGFDLSMTPTPFMYSIILGNVNYDAAPLVLTPHTPNHEGDVVSMFDVVGDLDIPYKDVFARGYSSSGREGMTVTKVIRTTEGDCTLVFTAGLLTGGTC